MQVNLAMTSGEMIDCCLFLFRFAMDSIVVIHSYLAQSNNNNRLPILFSLNEPVKQLKSDNLHTSIGDICLFNVHQPNTLHELIDMCNVTIGFQYVIHRVPYNERVSQDTTQVNVPKQHVVAVCYWGRDK